MLSCDVMILLLFFVSGRFTFTEKRTPSYPDFTSRNVIAAEIEKVIQALTSRAFNRNDFEKSLDRFYVAIEGAAKTLDNWTDKQRFLDTVYERFFQGFSIKQADTHGIVYTPQEIVDFMCASVEEVLQREFQTSLSAPGVKIWACWLAIAQRCCSIEVRGELCRK